MKSILKILFLLLCSSLTVNLIANGAVIDKIDYAILEGDTTIMQEQGTQILTDCAGVILDPGGYGNYPDNVLSTLTIQPPSPSVVTLFFSEFDIENGFDDFLIYDGPDLSSPLIGTYDGTELQGQTIVSSGGALTLVFDSDFIVSESGFVIDYSVAGGTETPIADFEVSQTTPIPLNFPVTFTDVSENAGSWLYNFGDGEESTEQNPTHAYTESGTFEVSLTISNCSNTNTYTQSVVIQESGQLEINPVETCVTLNSFATTTEQVSLTNTGTGDLYYNFTEINDDNPNSLTVILGTGTIPPGGTQLVNLFFSAGNLLGGTYTHDLLLQTGDLDQLEVIYPVKMTVIGIPLITVAPNVLNFPLGYFNTPQTDSLCITNLGTDTLHISDITIDSPGFSVFPTQLSIPPGGELKTQVTLLAEDTGSYSGVISIFSNASSTVTIPVFGEVIDAPVGIFNPDDICLNLAQGESTLLIMGVSNEGGEDLTWTFAFQNGIPDWLEVGILDDVLPANTSQTIPIIVNATGLTAGVYEYTATIFTNDPINEVAYLDVKLIVVAPPIANFSASNQNTCDGLVSFTDNSQGETTSWLWNFGDNTSSEEQNPIHIYEEMGTYDVSLIACNSIGCDTTLMESFINYSVGQNFCDTLIMGIMGDTTLYNCFGYIYDSGGADGNYASGTNYTTVINPQNASSIILTFDQFELENNFDDFYIYAGLDSNAPLLGVYSGLDILPASIIEVMGNAATLVFVSDNSVDRPGFAIAYACTLQQPLPNFTVNPSGICSNEIQFTNNSSFATSYMWDFGDGNSSNAVSPTHFFSEAGTYEVSMTAENDAGTATTVQSIEIFELPFTLNIITQNPIFINSASPFSYNSSANLSEVVWTTENGNTTSIDSPSFTFTELGQTEISLTGTDANGCQVTIQESIFVDEISKIRDSESISLLQVFPVPSSGTLHVELNLKEESIVSLALFNILGQQLFKKEAQGVSSMHDALDLSLLETGTYYLAVWVNGEFAGRRSVVLID